MSEVHIAKDWKAFIKSSALFSGWLYTYSVPFNVLGISTTFRLNSSSSLFFPTLYLHRISLSPAPPHNKLTVIVSLTCYTVVFYISNSSVFASFFLKSTSAIKTLIKSIAAPAYPLAERISPKNANPSIAEKTGSKDRISPV